MCRRDSVHALVEKATGFGDVTGLIHAAGVSPSQAFPATILAVTGGTRGVPIRVWEPFGAWMLVHVVKLPAAIAVDGESSTTAQRGEMTTTAPKAGASARFSQVKASLADSSVIDLTARSAASTTADDSR
jgi:hypothetical protein